MARRASATAHPRSRGENVFMIVVVATLTGSSPLTRGKRERRVDGGDKGRLIPAHAGKTRCRLRRQWPRWAHPRSRGENAMPVQAEPPAKGSSPLTRGKLDALARVGTGDGLIPAHAGKTTPSASRCFSYQAHPRSRGENGHGCNLFTHHNGSSPLTRGKRR